MRPGLGLGGEEDCVLHLVFCTLLGERALVLFSLVEDVGVWGGLGLSTLDWQQRHHLTKCVCKNL